jgi:PPK2 family polyphosphate:nucleotide phosphotransferase
MSIKALRTYTGKMHAKPGKKISLKKFDTNFNQKAISKKEGEILLKKGVEKLSEMQDKLYAHNQFSVLIIFQAMDAAGKDSAIKHVMSGLNPQGVKVTSFKTPSSLELDHDYLWRHVLALPARGEIGIHNRSHYENVLVTRVHPEFILNENLPGIDKVDDINESFWADRMKQINRFEKNLHDSGTIILKFFLHVSKKEQKRRFMERINDPTKNWKFSVNDLRERALWDKYMTAYEDLLSNTSHVHAPWFVIPADDKWFARLVIAHIIHEHFGKLELSYPKPSQKQLEELERAKAILNAEKD